MPPSAAISQNDLAILREIIKAGKVAPRPAGYTGTRSVGGSVIAIRSSSLGGILRPAVGVSPGLSYSGETTPQPDVGDF